MIGYRYGWIVAAGLFFLLVLAGLLSPAVIRAHIKRVNDDDYAEITFRAVFGLVNYRFQLPIIRLKGLGMELRRELLAENIGGGHADSSTSTLTLQSMMKSMDTIKMLMKHKHLLLGWVRFTLKHVSITEWRWRTAVGTGDAMWTAMMTGTVWSVKTTVIGLVSQLVRSMAEPQIGVEAVFDKPHFSTEGHVTAKMNLGFLIFATVNLMFRLKKVPGLKKGIVGWERILMRA
jgi:hypothetical protein